MLSLAMYSPEIFFTTSCESVKDLIYLASNLADSQSSAANASYSATLLVMKVKLDSLLNLESVRTRQHNPCATSVDRRGAIDKLSPSMVWHVFNFLIEFVIDGALTYKVCECLSFDFHS